MLQALINNWYAWADYYVAQLTSGPAAAPTGTFAASTRANGGRTDYNSLILDITNPSFDMNQLRVGDVVTSALSTTLTPNSTGSPATPGYDPSLNYTIVSIDQTARTVELSLPVKAKTVEADTFTFAPPQYIVRSSDAPAAAPTSITSIGTTAGQPFTINTANTAGLVNGMEVTISGVTDQTTNLPAAVNGRWVITNVISNTSFQLQGAGNGNGETLSGGIWSTSAGTIPYTLNFTPPSASITGISNANGQPIVITTGSTVGLVAGQQITISGLTGQTSINGAWTIKNVTATSFELAGITGTGGPVGDGVASSGGNWSPADALQFAQTVYDVMQTMSLLVDPTTQASRSASLLGYVIGGNTGSFVINQGFEPTTHRDTLLPDQRTALQLRDEIKSLLRGVYDFNAIQDESQWYPNPATPTAGATLNGTAVTFGIYNLDPYVWFVHDVLHNSSYGFSFDDDVANAQAASSTLQIAVGGNSYTAPNPQAPNVLPNPEAFSPFAQWGTQQSQGYIDTTSPPAIQNATAGQITISGLSQATVARLTASKPGVDHPGAFITSDSAGLLPAGATIVQTNALPNVTQTITGITNPNGGTVTINTANTGSLAVGDLVTISGVTGQTAINGRWVVANVVLNASFDLVGINGDGTASSGGSWAWDPSFVTFLKPASYTPPTDNAEHQFTFAAFLGTTVPANITSSASQAPPGTVVTINGTGLTGVYGVSFNGYAGAIVGSEITSITNTNGSPIVIGAADTTGLANGDTVTISDVIDETTGTPAAINGGTYVITNVVASTPTVPGSFQLTGANSTGDGHALGHGNWIAGSDTAFKAIVPNFVDNDNGTTHPGPIGAIGVRNQSGTNYSSSNFTIVATEINVLGSGVPITDGDTSPTTADATDFGDSAIAGGVVVRTFTISNTGTADLNLTGSPLVKISGADASDFTVTELPASTIAAAGSTTFQVTFNPSEKGLRSATITIANNDATEGAYQFAIQGTALDTWLPLEAPSPGDPIPFTGNADERFVEDLYRNLLNRAADPAGLAAWVSLYHSTGSSQAVVDGIFRSAEHRALEVQHLYQAILGRNGSDVEVQGWVAHLQAGATEEDVINGFLSSEEFLAGKDDAAFVQSLYLILLHRSGGANEIQGWVDLIQMPGRSRQDAIDGIFHSKERAELVVNNYYQFFLGRPGDAAGVTSWETRYTSGDQSEADIERLFLGSTEFAGLAR